MALVRKNAGDTIGVVDANTQFYDLFTGAMTDQPVTISNWFSTNYNGGIAYPASPPSGVGGAIGGNFSNGVGEVDYWNSLPTAVQSFRFYQKTGAASAKLIATMFPSGGVYIGTTPADPGAYGLTVFGPIVASALSAGQTGSDQAQLIASSVEATLSAAGPSAAYDLRLQPKGTGVIDFHYAATAAFPVTADTQKLAIKVNGTTKYLALYTA